MDWIPPLKIPWFRCCNLSCLSATVLQYCIWFSKVSKSLASGICLSLIALVLHLSLLFSSFYNIFLALTFCVLMCCTKARFPLPELTARVDGWPVSITRQHGPCWLVMETKLVTRQLGPSTRVVETGLNCPVTTYSLSDWASECSDSYHVVVPYKLSCSDY